MLRWKIAKIQETPAACKENNPPELFSRSITSIIRRDMSRILWRIVLSFLIWIPLIYIFIHRRDNADEHLSTQPQTALRYQSTNGNILRTPPPNNVDTIASSGKQLYVNFPPPKNMKQIEQPITAERFRVDPPIEWKDFVHRKHNKPERNQDIEAVNSADLIVCNSNIVHALQKPGLSAADYQWCEWALSSKGGKVVVGKSYGSLNTNEKRKFENLNCNNVAGGKNPSCDDGWGDGFVRSWRATTAPDMCGDTSLYTSKAKCMESPSTARFCMFENAVLDFGKMTNLDRPGRSTGTRKWSPGFLSTHCDAKRKIPGYFDFYQPSVSPESTRCDYVVDGTVLAYSHDDIKNLGHTMSDFLNVWLMLWLAQYGAHAKDIHFLNIDALRMGHNYHDVLSQFGLHYNKSFASVLPAEDFARRGAAKVCFKELILQPRPVVLFTWDGWWNDVPCTFVGPSAMFQRWNLQIRRSYGLLRSSADVAPTNERVQVLLLLREARPVLAGGSDQQSRVFVNGDELLSALKAFPGINFVAADLSKLSFEQQVRLVHSSSVLIGMHGAGIPASMHMAVGTKHCCGVIELFPEGEFKNIRGYGNMARRMGHHYERIALPSRDSRSNGTYVDPNLVATQLATVLGKIRTQPSCMLPQVLEDPFLQ